MKKKMVFLAGARQVGKTTLTRSIIKDPKLYLNWDIAEHRLHILKGEWPPGNAIIFDEIHKYTRWRNLLKGFYDAFKGEKKILVTGSARLDLYRRGGDSLQGRYHLLRLHPLSVAECKIRSKKDFLSLLHLGGFPEPFYSGSLKEAKRFSREYRTLLIREEVTSLETVKDLGTMELLALRLPQLTGSPLSLNALREDLQVNHRTVANWLSIFERLYYVFRLPPFGHPLLRAVKKEQKHYHLDWTLPANPAIRFENLVACHLLKWVHYRQDCYGEEYDLRYFRDIDRREVDFIVTLDGVPKFAIECKWNDREIDHGLRYFKQKFPQAEAFQLTAIGVKDYVSGEKIRVQPAVDFLRNLI